MKSLKNLLRIASLILFSAITPFAAQAASLDLPVAGGYDPDGNLLAV